MLGEASHDSISCKGAVYATGRRKSAISKVWLKKGQGRVLVKRGKKYLSVVDAFPVLEWSEHAMGPLRALDASAASSFDIVCAPLGGGVSGQAGAVRNGIAKALVAFDETLYRPILRAAGLCTRDSRVVQHKRPGYVKARKKAQKAKR